MNCDCFNECRCGTTQKGQPDTMLNRHIHTAARVSRAAAHKAALRALGIGTEVTLHLVDGDVVSGRITDVGFRTVWLVTPANDRSTAIDHVHKYEDVAIVGGI